MPVPTAHTYPLSFPGPAGNGVRTVESARRYAFTRAMSAANDTLVEGSRWVAGYPALEVVRRVLSTPLGSYAPNPRFGVDMSMLSKQSADLAQKWDASVRAALKFLTDSRKISRLKITIDAPANGRFLYEVSFVDPVSASVEPLKLNLSVRVI